MRTKNRPSSAKGAVVDVFSGEGIENRPQTRFYGTNLNSILFFAVHTSFTEYSGREGGGRRVLP